jgi:Luciferase-like monooxygenase
VGEFAATNILLTRAALATSRIRLGTQVTPVPRRRPRQLAREIATLDRLSGGRMILGFGLGDPIDNEYGRFGEPTDPKVLAGLLDEGLEAITLLWSGETGHLPRPARHHRRCDDAAYPRAIATSADLDRRALAAQGARPARRPLGRRRPHHRHLGAAAGPRRHRRNARLLSGAPDKAGLGDVPFELVVGGSTPNNAANARDTLGHPADAGATWRDERFPIHQLGKFDAVRTRLARLSCPAAGVLDWRTSRKW